MSAAAPSPPPPPAPNAEWLARSDADLAAGIARIRARLAALLPPPAAPPSPALTEPRRRGLFDRWRGGDDSEPLILLPPPTAANAPPAESAANDAGPPTALADLAARFGLSAFERDIVLLCLACELDTGIAATCAAVHGDPARDHPTLALALALAEAPEWAALSPHAPLRRWRLIEVEPPGTRPLTASAIRADERIVNFAKGLNELDARLDTVLLPPPARPLPPSQAALAAAAAAHLGDGDGRVALRGGDRDSRRAVAGAVAAARGLALHRLAAPAAGDADLLARLWHRETRLLPVALYLEGDAATATATGRFAARAGGVVFVDAGTESDGEAGDAAVFDVARPTPAEQAGEWRALFGERAGSLPERLAGEFDLSQAAIAALAAAADDDPGGDTVAAGGDAVAAAAAGDALWDAAKARARPALAGLATRVEVRARLDDLVLPPVETAQLQAIVAQVTARAQVYDGWDFRARMNRGLGISVLFAGDSGTGKTMAAEALASALRLDLYRIDLSQVVSKYIGETEKNLARVFDAAAAGGAVLLFDEADALFGKRSEVKDAHDRYANIEVDYLLQRIESFGGLAVLATNLRSAIDPAFVRRLRFIVTFPHPGVAERRAMWQRAFPPAVPLEPLDLDRLARLTLSGGNIHNVALAAAFAAAAAGGPVTTALVLDAARAELRKLDRPVNEAEFRAVAAVGRAS